MGWKERSLQVIDSPATHFWLKSAMRAALQADPVDAANDAEVLYDILDERCAEVLAQHQRSATARTIKCMVADVNQADGLSKKPPVFKVEGSLSDMMRRGEKPFDIRRHDMSDDRIYRLMWCDVDHNPIVKEVGFIDKASGETLYYSYLGVAFTDAMPGWCILRLGAMTALVRPEAGITKTGEGTPNGTLR